MEFRNTTLDNGLEIVAECNPDAYSTALGFFVRTGSRDENDTVHGVSHFLEHMVFKGTPRRSADDVNREFDELGAYYNAFTSEENTVYYAAVLPDLWKPALDLLGDLMRPSLRTEDFETEKKVIIEEIRMYEDQPPFGADEIGKEIFFGSHPLGRSILGTVESIEALSADQMRSYWQKRYSPGNLTLVAAGKIDFNELVAEAERICGSWEPCEVSRHTESPAPQSEFRLVHKQTATQEYLLQYSDGPAASDPLRYAAKVLSTIIGDETGSRFYWALIDPGLAEHASQSHYEYLDAGIMMTYMSCDPDRARDNVELIQQLFQAAESGGVVPQELTQAKRKISARVVLGSERPRSRLFNVGANWVQRSEYRAVADDLSAIDEVTEDDLHEVIQRWPLTRHASVLIGPLSDNGAAATDAD